MGVGDALASIIGKAYGTIRWPGQKKSVQGTAAFVFGLFAATKSASFVFNEHLSSAPLFLTCFLTGKHFLDGIY